MDGTKNQLGLTLVEILATVVILFIISMLTFNIVYPSNKQNVEQSAESVQINDAAYLMKQITKDIRRTHGIATADGMTIYSFFTYKWEENNKSTITYSTYTYDDQNNTLSRESREGGVIINNIKNFKIKDQNGDDIPADETESKEIPAVTIQFIINQKEYKTEVAFRQGNE